MNGKLDTIHTFLVYVKKTSKYLFIVSLLSENIRF